MQPVSRLSVDEIRLGDVAFWERPIEEREGDFVTLRRERPISFHEEPEVPMLGKGAGFWAVTRHADILEVSRNPDTYSSARRGVNIVDHPPELNEFFGSMIVLDDPRHTRLRRIVSRGFTPGVVRKLEDDVERAAESVIDAAYRFARHEPGIDVVLFGTSSVEHLKANVASILRPPLPAEDVGRLYALFGHLVGVGLDLPDHVKN